MPYQDDLRRYFGEIARYAEPALTAGSAAIAEPVSGLAGLGALLGGRGVGGAVESINAAQQAMTYQPRTMEGQQGLQGLQSFLQPIGEVIQGASQNLGDKAYSATGSPALAAAAYSAPTAFLEGLGLKSLSIARKPVSGADLYSARMGAGAVGDEYLQPITVYRGDKGGKRLVSELGGTREDYVIDEGFVQVPNDVFYFSPFESVASKYGDTSSYTFAPKNPFVTSNQSTVETLRSNPERASELRKQGYDSVIYKPSSGWGNDKPQYVALDKSVLTDTGQ